MGSNSSNQEIVRRYEALRSALGEIQEQFEHAARAFPNLFYETIVAPVKPMSQESWDNFIAANQSEDDLTWERWEVDSDGEDCVRYFGNREWFEHFRRLAESGFVILQEIEWLFGTMQDTPPGCELSLPSFDGYTAWCHVVDSSASVSTPFLRHVGRTWKLPDGQYADDNDYDRLMTESWEEPEDGGERFPKHPFCVALHENLFRSSAEAIRVWLQREKIVGLIDSYDEGVISLCSSDRLGHWLASNASAICERKRERDCIKPHFEFPSPENVAPRTFGKLTLGGILVKVFNQPAGNQGPILERFEEHDWKKRIPSPLHRENMSAAERRHADHALRQAVNALKKGSQGFLNFHADRGFVEWHLGQIPERDELFSEQDERVNPISPQSEPEVQP